MAIPVAVPVDGEMKPARHFRRIIIRFKGNIFFQHLVYPIKYANNTKSPKIPVPKGFRMTTPSSLATAETKLNDAADDLSRLRGEIAKVIFGQEDIIDKALISVLAGGHVLLIGAPGLAKTLLVETIGKVLGLTTARIQCTPDLMPSDILGSEVLDQDENGKRSFRFIKGPVFTQLLMADEINRASPRTQSALLQAMQEKRVSVNGQSHDLPLPFHVLATQNPIEQEGTYPMPEAQLDRFLMQIDVDYPSLDAERKMILATTSTARESVNAVLAPDRLAEIQQLVRDVPVGEQVIDAILKLVRGLRTDKDHADDGISKYIAWAPGPRAAQSLTMAVKARALYDGRAAPSVDDVIYLAEPVIKHRMALNYAARADGITLSSILARLSARL
jgi:MoxR-like ATPase